MITLNKARHEKKIKGSQELLALCPFSVTILSNWLENGGQILRDLFLLLGLIFWSESSNV
jgi:hypothetical protein